MKSFNSFINESDQYVCKCLRNQLTKDIYEEQRKKYPDLSKKDFFRKIKDYLSEKAGVSRCRDFCEKKD
jgi:hypothetical protein